VGEGDDLKEAKRELDELRKSNKQAWAAMRKGITREHRWAVKQIAMLTTGFFGARITKLVLQTIIKRTEDIPTSKLIEELSRVTRLRERFERPPAEWMSPKK
jgi:hypothetical protein